jgi:hypothetical protein
VFLQKWHWSCENHENTEEKGGETIMKNFKANWSIVLLVGVLGTSGAALAADGVVVQGELSPGSYCHEKFPAMRTRTLDEKQPQLKDSGSGDVIDYYGPCDTDPTGSDQVAAQKLEQSHLEGSKLGGGGRF